MFPVTGFQLPGKKFGDSDYWYNDRHSRPGNWRLVTLQPVTDD